MTVDIGRRRPGADPFRPPDLDERQGLDDPRALSRATTPRRGTGGRGCRSFPTYGNGGIAVSEPEGRELPRRTGRREAWSCTSAPRASHRATSPADRDPSSLGTERSARVVEHRPSRATPGLIQLPRAVLPARRRDPALPPHRLSAGQQRENKETKCPTIFLIDGQPAGEDSEDPLTIERELAPGLHEIQVWRHEGRDRLPETQTGPALRRTGQGGSRSLPRQRCSTPPPSRKACARRSRRPATITSGAEGGLDVAFGDQTRARLVRLVIQGFEGVAPTIRKVTLTDREGTQLLPVAQDYKALRENTQLEVLPGDQITARYEDPVSATPKRDRHEQRLSVAFNTATITASFLNYRDRPRRANACPSSSRSAASASTTAVAIVIDDADMDGSPERDIIEFTVTTSGGETVDPQGGRDRGTQRAFHRPRLPGRRRAVAAIPRSS